MRAAGQQWEARAERWLQQRGLKTIERNYCTRLGEIDLIMRDDETVVFVEVKFRKSDNFGSGAEAVTAQKRGRLIRAAQHFLGKHSTLGERPCRFDVISIQDGMIPRYEWIQNAFDAS